MGWHGILAGLLIGVATYATAENLEQGQSKDRITVQALLPQLPSKTIIGQEYAYPKDGPLLQSDIIEIPVGQKTGVHLHRVPLLAYILSGKLETHYGSKGIKTSSAGDLFVEAMDWCHFGRAVGTSPVKILAIYLNSAQSTQQKSVECKALQ